MQDDLLEDVVSSAENATACAPDAPTKTLTAVPTAQAPVVMGQPASSWEMTAGRNGNVGRMDEMLATKDE